MDLYKNSLKNQNWLENDLNKTVEELFNKTFVLSHNDKYDLPNPESMFNENNWIIQELQDMKNNLNATKSLLNNFNLVEWGTHTTNTNKSGEVLHQVRNKIQPELLTQAWCKFYELVSSHQLVPEKVKYIEHLTTIHLCEAPGAFITSLNHWLKSQNFNVDWNWLAVTLNPYYEGNSLSTMIDDDRFIRYTLEHWCFGNDFTGNIMNLNNLDSLLKMTKLKSDILLVTADGSIDCKNTPDIQELVVAHLHYCETISALHLLDKDGSFLLKIFTTFESQTICILYLLACCFKKICLTKPATSKEGNSECYVVCTQFKGPDYVKPYLKILRQHYQKENEFSMFCLNDIPHKFIQQIIQCAKFFKEHQCNVIEFNVRTFSMKKKKYGDPSRVKLKKMVADKFIKNYKLKPLSIEKEIVGKIKLKQSLKLRSKSLINDSFLERIEKQSTKASNPKIRLEGLKIDLNNYLENLEPDKIEMSFYNLTDRLWICTGQVFQTVKNSKFCNQLVLTIQQDVVDIMTQLKVDFKYPMEEHIQAIKKTSNTETVIFRYTDSYNTNNIINVIYDKWKTLTEGKNLMLIGYTLMTHFNIGFLNLLGHSFETVVLEKHNTVGSLILLKNYKESQQVNSYFIEIMNEVSKADCSNSAVLSIYPVKNLHDTNFCEDVININHWVIKQYVTQAYNYIYDVINETFD